MSINYVLELIHWIKKYIRKEKEKNNLFYNHTKTKKQESFFYLNVVMYLPIGLAN